MRYWWREPLDPDFAPRISSNSGVIPAETLNVVRSVGNAAARRGGGRRARPLAWLTQPPSWPSRPFTWTSRLTRGSRRHSCWDAAGALLGERVAASIPSPESRKPRPSSRGFHNPSPSTPESSFGRVRSAWEPHSRDAGRREPLPVVPSGSPGSGGRAREGKLCWCESSASFLVLQHLLQAQVVPARASHGLTGCKGPCVGHCTRLHARAAVDRAYPAVHPTSQQGCRAIWLLCGGGSREPLYVYVNRIGRYADRRDSWASRREDKEAVMTDESTGFDSVSKEGIVYQPPEWVKENAWISSMESTRRCTTARSPTPEDSGPTWPPSLCTGTSRGTRSSSGSSRPPRSSGSSAARPTSRTTASTDT